MHVANGTNVDVTHYSFMALNICIWPISFKSPK